LLLNEGSFSKASAPPLFLEEENIFQKSATMWNSPWNHRDRFLKNVLLFEKKEGVLIFFPGVYGGLYGQNLPHKFKKSYGDFQNRNFEISHRTTGPRSDLRPDS
jgi:hypothetical protein